jgi:hypothetical protein
VQGLLDAAGEISGKGAFGYVDHIVSSPDLVKYRG